MVSARQDNSQNMPSRAASLALAEGHTRMEQLLIDAERHLQWTCQDIQILVARRSNNTNVHCMRCKSIWLRGHVSLQTIKLSAHGKALRVIGLRARGQCSIN